MRVIIFFSMLVFLIQGCKKVLKNYEDYYPEVEVTETMVREDGSVLVFGRIISPGKYKGSKIEHVGFCLSKEGEPKMAENQMTGKFLDDEHFSAVYPQFYIDVNSTIYFRAFATNDFGYSLSQTKAFDSLFLKIDPPCTINDMYYQSVGFTGYYDNVQNYVTDNMYIAYHGSRSFSVRFPGTIRAGIFKTSSDLDGANNVICHVNNTTSLVIPNGQEIYVEKTGPTSYKVTVCSLDVLSGQTTLNYKGSFNVSL